MDGELSTKYTHDLLNYFGIQQNGSDIYQNAHQPSGTMPSFDLFLWHVLIADYFYFADNVKIKNGSGYESFVLLITFKPPI